MAKIADVETTSSEVTAIPVEKELAAQKILKKYAAIAVTAGFVPVPLLDIATLAGIQVKAIQEIAHLHGQDLSDHKGKAAVSTVITALSANPVSKVGASLLKVVPVLGGALSAVAFHGYAAASTYALGSLFHQHFATGGTVLDFDATKAKDAYKKLVTKYKSKDETAPATA